MYYWQDAYTEEGNQTIEECDLVIKDKRKVLMTVLEDKISSVSTAMGMTIMAMSRFTAASTVERQVQACISGTRSFDLKEI
jgi:hypothetical protein